MNPRSVVYGLIAAAIAAVLILLIAWTDDPCSTPGWFTLFATPVVSVVVRGSEPDSYALVACDRFGPDLDALGALIVGVLFCIQGFVVAKIGSRSDLLSAALVAVVTTLTGDVLLIYFATERLGWEFGELIGLVLEVVPAAAFAVIGSLIQRRLHADTPKSIAPKSRLSER